MDLYDAVEGDDGTRDLGDRVSTATLRLVLRGDRAFRLLGAVDGLSR